MADQAEWVKRPRTEADDARCSAQDYEALYARSIEDADGFWADQAERLDWIDKPRTVADWSFDPVDIKWFSDGTLNICHNAVDRHVENGHGDAIALIFEPDDPADEVRRITYADLQREVVRMASTFKKMGVQKGDRVTIYMPMVPEGACAMLDHY